MNRARLLGEIGECEQALRVAAGDDQSLAATHEPDEPQSARPEPGPVGRECGGADRRLGQMKASHVAFAAREAREALQAATKVQFHFGGA